MLLIPLQKVKGFFIRSLTTNITSYRCPTCSNLNISFRLSPFILCPTNRLQQWIVGCKHIIHPIHHTPCSSWINGAECLCAYLLSQYVRTALCSSWITCFFRVITIRSQGSGLSSTLDIKENQHYNFITIVFKFLFFFFPRLVSILSNSSYTSRQWFEWMSAIFL